MVAHTMIQMYFLSFESSELDGKIALIVGVCYACMPVLLGGTCLIVAI